MPRYNNANNESFAVTCPVSPCYPHWIPNFEQRIRHHIYEKHFCSAGFEIQSNTVLENKAYPSEFMVATTFCFRSRSSFGWTFGSWPRSLSVATPFFLFPDAFLFDLTLPITGISPQSLFVRDYGSINCDCKTSREFNGLFLLRVLGCPNLVFHWSAVWLSWQPLW